MTNPKCLHCDKTLRRMKELEEKGRKDVFECKKCGCVFGYYSVLSKRYFTLITGSAKCKTLKKRKDKELKGNLRKKKRKKRGRKKKSYLSRTYHET